jgi:small-conductance mechanosensitive channel
MLELTQFWRQTYFGNSLWQWALAVGVATLMLSVLLLIRRIVHSNYVRIAGRPQRELLELPLKVAAKTTAPFLLIVSVFTAVQTLEMPDKLRVVLLNVLAIALFWQAGVWGSTAVLAWLDRKREASLATDRSIVGTLDIIAVIARFLIWALVLLLTLDNLGVDITALVAGLGIGGIAVALAVQNVLGDLLASLTITLDRPFVVGDFIIVGEFMGSVEQIGVKSVRLRSLSGEQIIMPNADLIGSRVRNFGRMVERRVVFKLGVAYETPREKLQRIPAMIRGFIESRKPVRFDRCHLSNFGASALEFEIVYFVLTADFNQYMDVQQAINFSILESFERDGIEIAYPTQKILLTRVPKAQPELAAEPKPA